MQNLKEKKINNPTKHLTETEKLLKFIEEHIKIKDITIKTKLNENNELKCLLGLETEKKSIQRVI